MITCHKSAEISGEIGLIIEGQVENRASIDCDCSITVTNPNDFVIGLQVFYVAEECIGGVPSQANNCNGCNFIEANVLFPGNSIDRSEPISNTFQDSELSRFSVEIENLGSERICTPIEIELNCGVLQ